MVNPLHAAVIDNDHETVKNLKNSTWCTSPDRLGFTPLEIARLLGRQRCEEILSTIPPLSFDVWMKGAAAPETLSVSKLERTFNMNYRRHLFFPSYEALKEVISECPYLLRCRWLVKENYAYAERYRNELAIGSTAKISIKWIDQTLEYGAFLDEDVAAGAYIGEYTGIVRRLFREKPDHNAYCFSYPTRLWNKKPFTIDALVESNIMRFCNHSDRPNLDPCCVVDRGLLHQIFISNRPLAKGTQLTFDYGEDYWERRRVAADPDFKSPFRKILERNKE